MRHYVFFAVLLFTTTMALGHEAHDPYAIRYVSPGTDLLRPDIQKRIQQAYPWQRFVQRFPGWQALFDERNGLPHRAYGPGLAIDDWLSPADKARKFIAQELNAFGVQSEQLRLRNVKTSKYHYVDFYQQYQNVEVLHSRVTVRLTLDGKVVLFGADYFADLSISTQPLISATQAAQVAASGMAEHIHTITVDPALKILPIPVSNGYRYHLVYTCFVEGRTDAGMPFRYRSHVDAHDGSLLARENLIRQLSATVTINASVSINPTQPNETHHISHLRIRVNGTDYYTNEQGTVTIPNISSATTATLYIQGLYSRVYKGNANSITNYNITIYPGNNDITLSNTFNVRERSGYYHTTLIHDYMKSWFPNFTLLDDDLITRVDVNGSCNAYYDGNSINFYEESATCNAIALVGDVVYHEYGHAINDHYYAANGYNFNNGAMDEGYADVWAMAITDYPEIARGFYKSTNAGIREYQNSIKVYPKDIVGEVHADGEIIAGSWWWTRYLIGDMSTMMAIFTESYNGFANGANGQEGIVFRDILLDALMADDDNANINDGTPHSDALLQAFALHGITLIGNITLSHAEPLSAASNKPVVLKSNVTVSYPSYLGNVFLHYKEYTANSYQKLAMTKTIGSTYEVTLPAQPKGTLLAYYFTVEDIYGNLAFTDPPGVIEDVLDENIPYFLFCGYQQVHTEDFDNYAGAWQIGAPGDKATTGIWIIDEPQATFQTPGDPSSMVQTGTDHTTVGINSNICAVTANNLQPSDPYNYQDVDGGATTLFSPVFDLTAYENPAISYYRWYTNEASANPRNDHWKVFITNDLTDWHVVEWNNYPQRAWRNFAFRVQDLITPSSTVQLKFVAEDSVIAGAFLDGGSIVEAAVDDLYIWEEYEEQVGLPITQAPGGLSLLPNPASQWTRCMLPAALPGTLVCTDLLGNVVYKNEHQGPTILDVRYWPSGTYFVHFCTATHSHFDKLIIKR